MEAISNEFMDALITSIVDGTASSNLSTENRKILTSNLNVLNILDINLSTACKNKLANFLRRYVENLHILSNSDFSEIQQLIILILKVQESVTKQLVTIDVLSHLVDKAESARLEFETGVDTSKEQCYRCIKLIDIILTNIEDSTLYVIFSQEMICRMDKFIVSFLLDVDVHSVPHALPLFSTYLKKSKNWDLFQRSFHEILDRTLKNDIFIDGFITIVSYFIDFFPESERFAMIFDNDEFWKVLRKCFTNESCERKYLNHVLKFALLKVRQNTREGIWNCKQQKQYELWWMQYFVIVEILEEKQTHLVLPIFSSINDLISDPVVKIDNFWFLVLFQAALEHDSRTIRIKALFCLLNAKQDICGNNHFALLTKIFLTAVNDSALMRKLYKNGEFDNFTSAVILWINSFLTKDEKNSFFKSLFLSLCRISWSSIPLYYILEIFIRTDVTPCLDIKRTEQLQNTILNVTRSHNIFIRAAIQCLLVKFVTKIFICSIEEVPIFLDFLSNFNDDECWLRGVFAWSNAVTYLKSTNNAHFIENFVCEKLVLLIDCDERTTEKIVFLLAKKILLLHDAFGVLDEQNRIRNRIDYMISSFSSALSNPYLSTRAQDNYLMLISALYNEIRNESRVKNTSLPLPSIVNIIEQYSIFLFSYSIQRMIKSENNAELLDFYEKCLQNCRGCVRNFLKSTNSATLLNECWNKCITMWQMRNGQSAYCCSKILLWIYEVILENPKRCRITNIDYVKIVIENFISNPKPSFEKIDAGRSNIASNYTNTMWSIFELFLKFEFTTFSRHFKLVVVFDFIMDTLDSIRKENLYLVLNSLKHLISNETTLKYEEAVYQLMDDSWKRLEEIHSTPYYHECLKYWIQAFFQKSVIRTRAYQAKVEQFITLLSVMASENGGQSYRYVILILDEFENVEDLFRIFPGACHCLINIYCITHVDRKDQRMEYQTEEKIRSKAAEISANQIRKFDPDYSTEVMRLKVLNIVLKLNKYKEETVDICLKFIELLVVIEKNLRKRYFNDSACHRIKHKKLQLLLIIETIAHKKALTDDLKLLKVANLLYDFAIHSLLSEPHQPSIRYMLEWLTVRLVLHYSSLFYEKFWNSFSEASEERIGSVCSFISVAFHVSNVSQNDVFINEAVKCILPWAMGQHFNARLYAQTVLLKLINMNERIKKRYEIVEESLNNCLRKGNAVKNAMKLQEDFYFCSFHPVDHFSLSMILWDLPKLSGICREEWLSKTLFDQYLTIEADCQIPLYHYPDSFSKLTSSSWIVKATTASHHDGTDWQTADNLESCVNFIETQKKFIPSDNNSNNSTSTQCDFNRRLIVVASLIDRAPNLGGLTRTCEIFAVSKLVVNNLDVVRQKEFTSLSITAEKHVEIIEVKRQNLYEYLMKLKDEDFCIVGAEQTTKSKKLQQFKFSSKSVVVLGNEKGGIPASLLPLLDVCVEIPQSGVIRSLNVHVSASLLIWEFAKQHHFFGTN